VWNRDHHLIEIQILASQLEIYWIIISKYYASYNDHTRGVTEQTELSFRKFSTQRNLPSDTFQTKYKNRVLLSKFVCG
jgi:hypothetical protein